MASAGAGQQPVPPTSAGLSLDDAAQRLRDHLALCQELLSVVERENRALRSADEFHPAEFREARNGLLPRLNRSSKALQEVRLGWQRLAPSERQRRGDITGLLRQAQDLSMKILLLDRENEQRMLRRGLLPAGQLPSAQRQRPHFVAELYRRSRAP